MNMSGDPLYLFEQKYTGRRTPSAGIYIIQLFHLCQKCALAHHLKKPEALSRERQCLLAPDG